ncbi:hypothetical protein SAMN03159338_1821 [Sphingomonas sp. NFR04]|uniref:hypothetical protein n=1 Tax=Sphingomonas sp. NFR04 TaxID=1566283 RepID=UPI0008E04CC5|nr:hypothetical protein [Sphingomonas sp. NFR04]SFJ57511.1 hypothetical protein SAMN03159338_1821 [Sphingomonas sp. NFR04]
MSTRTSSLLALLLVAGCGADPVSQPAAQAGETVACGPVGETLLPVCTVERDGAVLILHHPDGGFRRLQVQGNVITAADGAEVATVTHAANATEVTIGGMRYRLAGKGVTAGP